MTTDFKLVAALQYIQNAIDNIEPIDMSFADKNELYYCLTKSQSILKEKLKNG